ncbi:hypothetical protein V490_04073 [Pseudogymnoascus sp. VKM F-3557]|nr:hypothetical protein V490_04073 [Pseudogymnoascus sp. VKM F-3557]
MSQFTAVNPTYEEAPVAPLATTSFKEEGMEEDTGIADATETPEQAPNTTKKRAPKTAVTNADGTPKTPRKNAKAKVLNEDGTPVAKATPSRKKAEPQLDEDGNPIPKTPRKRADSKPRLGPDGEPLPKTPRKTPAKRMKSEAKVVEEAEDMPIGDMVSSVVGDMATAKMPGYAGYDAAPLQSYDAPTPNGGSSPVGAVQEPTTPKAKKSATKSRAATSTPAGKNKRAADEDGDNDAFTTPTKKIRATATTPKSGNGKGMAIATSKDQLTEEDRMMIQWRKDGKGWNEIRTKWAEMTGKPVGNSTLPNRYKRLMANITDWKDGDLERMLLAEKQVTKAFASELYSRMATVMVQLGADTYTAAAIEKAYVREKREGFPHAATIDQVINGAPAPANDDEAMEDIDQAINGVAAAAGKDQAMEDPETPDEGNSDGRVPISPGHGFNSQDSYQNGVGASIKGGDDAEMDSDMI